MGAKQWPACGGIEGGQLDLGTTITGLASTKVTLAVGNRMVSSPWVTVTAAGDPIVRTAQTRLYVEAAVAPSMTLALLGATSVRLPLYVELAEAQARLSRITCGNGDGERSAALQAQASPGHASLVDLDTGALADMSVAPVERPARVVALGPVGINAQTRLDLASGDWQTVAFSTSEVAAHTTKTITSTGTVGALAQSLTDQVSLSANIGSVTVANPAATGAARLAILAIAPLLDGVVASLTDLLGVHLGQADLRINGLRCGQAALVA